MRLAANSEENLRGDVAALANGPNAAPIPCCCAAPSVTRRFAKSDISLSLAGVIGWFLLPKCPLCLAAYLALSAGLSLTALQSRVLYTSLAAIAVSLIAGGALRILAAFWRSGRNSSSVKRNAYLTRDGRNGTTE
jgi:hypothetical protein